MTTLVWISGASSGIGRALADTVPWADARVVGISRRGGSGVEHLQADLAHPDAWRTVAAAFDRDLAAFNAKRALFVHSAATLHPIGFAGEVDPDAYASQVVLNSACPQVLGDAFVRAAERHRVLADLVMLTSGAATSVYEGWSAYGAGKAAVDHWVRIVGAERRRRGSHVRVLAIAPGVVATAMQEQIRATDVHDFPHVDRFVDLHEDGDLRDPHDAARAIWRLVEGGSESGSVVDVREVG